MSISDKKIKACVIDDDELIRKLLSYTLESLGCEVTTFEDGSTAEESIAAKSYDILFIDIMMPEMDGITCCKNFRNAELNHPQGTRIPIIGVTGGSNENEPECVNAGMTEVLHKPFTKSQIANILHRHANCKGDDTCSLSTPISIQPATDNCFDKSLALESLDGNEEMFPSMVKMFVTLQPQLLEELKLAQTTKDPQLLQITAHTLKTRALYVGGASLNEFAKETERLCKTNEFNEAFERVPALIIELEQLITVLKKLNIE